jgi:hypothetical protein
MIQAVTLVLLLAVAAAFWWHRMARQKKRRSALAARRNAHNTQNSFHCVEVFTGVHGCEAAQLLVNSRFLSDEAPRLPVSGCTAIKCTCSYIHHEDRREEDDRRYPFGQWARVPPTIAGERRSRTERRKSQKGTFRSSMAR